MANYNDVMNNVGDVTTAASQRKKTLLDATKAGGYPTTEGGVPEETERPWYDPRQSRQFNQGVAQDLRGAKGQWLGALGVGLAGEGVAGLAGKAIGAGVGALRAGRAARTAATAAPRVEEAASEIDPAESLAEHMQRVWGRERGAGRAAETGRYRNPISPSAPPSGNIVRADEALYRTPSAQAKATALKAAKATKSRSLVGKE